MRQPGGDAVVGVIDYRTGNSQSVAYALTHLGIRNRLITTPDQATEIDRVILPGVGAAGTTMRYLNDAGWPEWLTRYVMANRMPFLGICVGLQVLFEHSAEQDTACLGWLPGYVQQFDRDQVRVPQMGWNQVYPRSNHPFVQSMPGDGHFYFVNSYYASPTNDSDVAAFSEYGTKFCSIVARGNIMATQFHIEKSGALGLRLLARFAALTGEELC